MYLKGSCADLGSPRQPEVWNANGSIRCGSPNDDVLRVHADVRKELKLNRKELAYAAVGVALGAAGCAPQMKSLVVPAANAEERTDTPHLEEAVITLISGTTRDVSSALFHLLPKSGWSIISSDPRLEVSINNGHVATLVAPENEKALFVAKVTISHTSGMEFMVRCHVETKCSD
jgi:hypothetical protein